MSDEFELYDMLDSITLHGQYQASGVPITRDSSLDDQILGNFDPNEEHAFISSSFDNPNDINNALIYPSINEFGEFLPCSDNTAESLITNTDYMKLLSVPFGETPMQSEIVEKLETMNLYQSHTESLPSSIAVQIGSSPMEHKIDNSILATNFVQQRHQIDKSTSKSRKSSKHSNSSSNVGPIDILTSYGGCQPCTTIQMQDGYDIQQQILQCDSVSSKKIEIISQPRTKFRPRTQNESRYASHYIRCEMHDEHDYPTIKIPYIWACQSVKNIVEVTLVGIDGEPHPYSIDNKMCGNSLDENTFIFKQQDINTLYFCVTNDDFKNGYKSFMIEYIKSKQGEFITKELIKTRQLDQSRLRFTRIYQTEKDTYEKDEGSTEYSCVMTEAYGDIVVEHMGPKYGPMSGNERVYTLLRGRILKDDITVFITENTSGWRRQLQTTKNGNLIYFSTPPYPFPGPNQGVTNITICYKGEEVYQSPYLYQGSLDQALAELNLNDSNSTDDSSSDNDVFDFFSATGACPIQTSSRRSTTAKKPKRIGRK